LEIEANRRGCAYRGPGQARRALHLRHRHQRHAVLRPPRRRGDLGL